MSTPYLVFGGPYSNLQAVEALRARAALLGIDPARTICTGDVVAYCGDPEVTVAAIRAWGCRVVAGNCEEQLARDAGDCGCGFDTDTACDRLAKDWYSFARRRISSASRSWMAGLPSQIELAIEGRRVRVVHGGLDRVNRFVFGSEAGLIADEFSKTDADIVVGGHAGIPFIARVGRRVWFNPGVIGMPANDGTPDVWYGLITADGEQLVLSTHRLAYGHGRAAAATLAGGHADAYARALTTGLWPSTDILPPPELAMTGRRLAEQVVRIGGRN